MAQLFPVSLQVPAVAGSMGIPFKAYPGRAMGPVRGVATVVSVGVNVAETETFCAVMVLGLLWLGKVPIAWSGRPLAVSERSVLLQDQVAVAVAVRVALLYGTLLL
ncbi:MAG: hypothetical protein WCI85_12330 [Comamonadaceae bacterium]